MHKTTEQWIKLFTQRDAWWTHDGNRLRPHVILHSGLHSDGFFMSKLVTNDPKIRRMIAEDMAHIALQSGQITTSRITCVIGAPTSATALAADIHATGIFPNARYLKMDKREDNGRKEMFFIDEKVRPKEEVILVEDVTTTADSLELTAQSIVAEGGRIYPVVLTILNRSGRPRINGRNLLALVNYHMSTWEPAESCPLCAVDSRPMRAKVPPENWEVLKRDYPTV